MIGEERGKGTNLSYRLEMNLENSMTMTVKSRPPLHRVEYRLPPFTGWLPGTGSAWEKCG